MKLGVIGVGNMGSAIIRGCIASGMPAEEISGAGRSPGENRSICPGDGNRCLQQHPVSCGDV